MIPRSPPTAFLRDGAQIAHELRVESLMPHAMLLLCPVVNICRSPSPSRISFASDVLLPMPLLRAFGAAYDQAAEMAETAVAAMEAP
eukprot:6213488-Pleurochrysis_carterae.AAC.2